MCAMAMNSFVGIIVNMDQQIPLKPCSMKTKRKNKSNENTNQGHKGPRTSMKKRGNSHKKGCCSFIIKMFYLCPTIVEVCYATFEHINKLGLVVHGNVKFGYMPTFFAHVSKEIRAFVLENLWLGLSIYQVMNKHKSQVKEIMENNKDLSRDLILCEEDIRNLVGNLAKETYKKHENDAKNVRMWVFKNNDKVFFYQESKVEVEGTLQGCNMTFITGIQTEWQEEMMFSHGHESGVFIDATFGTNDKKIIAFLFALGIDSPSNM